MKVDLFNAGYCTAVEALACQGSPWRQGRFGAGFALVTPAGGEAILFDTGYSGHVLRAMSRMPNALYGRALPIKLADGESASAQLERRGVAPDSVRTIVISHFHPDHIGGARDFPKARFVCSRRAWEAMRGLTGWRAMRNGYFPELLPDDFASRVSYAEELPPWPEADGWGGWRLANGWGGWRLAPGLRLVPLEGHAPGQIGLWIDEADIFLISDAAWRRVSVETGAAPHPLAMTVQHDRAAYRATLKRLGELARARPALRFIPTHETPA